MATDIKSTIPTQKYKYRVTLKKGLGGPFIFEAENTEMATRMGIAEYRFYTGYDESVDMLTRAQVIDNVELLTDKA